MARKREIRCNRNDWRLVKGQWVKVTEANKYVKKIKDEPTKVVK